MTTRKEIVKLLIYYKILISKPVVKNFIIKLKEIQRPTIEIV